MNYLKIAFRNLRRQRIYGGINIGPRVFLTAGALTLGVAAFLTVSYYSIKAALTNPAESLRYE